MSDDSGRHFKPPRMTDRARDLRHDATQPERVLWSILRGGRLNGLKFRRQHTIGRYVVDYFCHDRNLIVELDGLTHVNNPTDDERQRWLESQGYRVIRFTNDDVLQHLEAVAEAIIQAAADI